MNYRQFGKTGLRVSPLCLGCMTFGREIDEPASVAIIDRARDAGVNFFDTANVYAGGRSEEIVGRALKPVRDSVVIASKFSSPTGDGPNDRGGSRRVIMAAIDASLKRLDTDYIDIYQIHHVDPDTPIEETLDALDDVVRAGKVRYIGCSNFAAWQIMKALWVSDRQLSAAFVSVQPRYSLVFREPEAELFPMCQSEGIAVMSYSPLGGGFLTGKYRQGEPVPADTRMARRPRYSGIYGSSRNYQLVEGLTAYAKGQGIPKEEIAIAWVASHPAVTAPIAGVRTLSQLETALSAVARGMSTEQRAEVTALTEAA